MANSPKAFNVAANDNPLINPPQLPYGAPAFDKVEAAHILPAIEWALERFQANVEAIKNNPEAASFENTIVALELASADIERVKPILHTLASNNSNDAIREIEQTADSLITPVDSTISMDGTLFARIKAVYDVKDTLALDTEQTALLEKTYNDRVRAGALLNDADKERLKEINTELSRLTTKFAQNSTKGIAAFKRLATVEELKGVPERSLKIYQQAAINASEAASKNLATAKTKLQAISEIDPAHFKSKKARGIVIEEAEIKVAEAKQAAAFFKDMPEGAALIKLQPHPQEIMTHCENRALRKEISEASGKICDGGEFDNRQNAIDIATLRHEKALLLGFENHADFVLSDRMAGSQKAVEDFLENNRQAYYPSAKAFFEEVKSLALASGDIETFETYDLAYYDRILVEQKFDFDEESLRPYFEIGNVINGFRKHIEDLFDVDMVEVTGQYPAYRDDAQVYEVKDRQSGEVLSLFYADYFADAAAKRGGAWMNPFRNRHTDQNGNDIIPIVTNSCNYQKPLPGQPSLLSLREVETLFHEGGHGFHAILAKGKYSSLNGTNVKWDFVELPSQLMENWVKQPEVLQSFATHHETGEPIPAEFIEKIIEMSTYDSGYVGLRQTSLGLIDMGWHTGKPGAFEAVEDKVHKLTSFFPERKATTSQRFSHLFSSPSGYSAGYYSYKWAEVLEADVFEEFKREGLYDPATSKRLKETIFTKGGQVGPMDLFKEMMGREPNPDALFRREGILPEKEKGVEAAPTAAAPDNHPDIGQP